MSHDDPNDATALAAMLTSINRIVKATRDMRHELGRDPTPEELAARLALPAHEVRKIVAVAPPPIIVEPPAARPGRADKLPEDATLRRMLGGDGRPALTADDERLLRERFGIDK